MRKLLTLLGVLALVVVIGCSKKDDKDKDKAGGGTGGGGDADTKLTVKDPGEVTITAGMTAAVKIAVERGAKVTGDLAVSIDPKTLPEGVTVDDKATPKMEIAKGKNDFTITLKADPTAKEGSKTAEVTVKGDKEQKVSFKVTVKKAGGEPLPNPEDTKLSVNKIDEVTLEPGKSQDLKISVERGAKVLGDLGVEITGLPDGVTVDKAAKMEIAKGANEVAVALKADATAKDGSSDATITVKGAGGAKDATAKVKVTVKKK